MGSGDGRSGWGKARGPGRRREAALGGEVCQHSRRDRGFMNERGRGGEGGISGLMGNGEAIRAGGGAMGKRERGSGAGGGTPTLPARPGIYE